jgi:hypothetical protein
MTARQRLLWLKRVIEYGFNYYILEKPRGLDFSKRRKNKKSSETSTGYALTSSLALENIFEGIPFGVSSRFLDVGGGKAGTSVFALRMGFGSACSLELEEYLHDVACKNISVLGLKDKIELINKNAFEYRDYAHFSHIFMFNLLVGDLHRDLLSHIADCLCEGATGKDATFYISIYGELDFQMLEDGLCNGAQGRAQIDLVKNEICPFRGNNIRVFKLSC